MATLGLPCCVDFLSLWRAGVTFSYGVWMGFSWHWLPLWWSTGPRAHGLSSCDRRALGPGLLACGLVVPWHVEASQTELCPLALAAESYPLHRREVPAWISSTQVLSPLLSSLENSMHRGAWRAVLRGGHKESDTTERLNTQASWLLTSGFHATVCDSVSLVCGNRSLKVSPARVSIPFIKPNSNFPVLTLVIRFPNGERKLDVQPSLCLLQIVLLLEVLLYLHSGSCLTGVRFPLHCPWLIDTKASCSHHDWRRLEQLNQLGSRPGEK